MGHTYELLNISLAPVYRENFGLIPLLEKYLATDGRLGKIKMMYGDPFSTGYVIAQL